MTVIAIPPLLKQAQSTPTITSDILESLGVLTIAEFDNVYTKQLISDGEIADTSNSILEQIAEFYVTNETIARALATEALSSVPPSENVGIWYSNVLLASQNITPLETAENVFTDRQTISGIGGTGMGVTGFSTRAALSSSSRTSYTYFGGYIGEGNITSIIDYQGNISSATIELVINEDFEIFVNDNLVGSFSASPDDFTPVSYDLNTTDFNSGNNTFQIKGNNLHIAGGFIKITYVESFGRLRSITPLVQQRAFYGRKPLHLSRVYGSDCPFQGICSMHESMPESTR